MSRIFENTAENTAHGVAREEVMAYLDGELAADEAVAVAAHLRECVECADLAEGLGGVSRGLRAWTVEAAPASLEREIRRAAKGKTAGSGARGRRVGTRWMLVWSGTLAAVLVLGVVFRVSYLESRPSRRAMFEMAQPDAAPMAAQSAGAAGIAGSNFASLQQLAPGVVAQRSERARGGGGGASTGYTPQGPMIARAVSLTVLVKDFDAARAKLTRILDEHRGYAAEMTILDADPPRGLEGGLRIPISQLDPALTQIRALGRVEKETQKGEEVTQQHADLVARLTNSREEEQRLRALLAQRTGKIEDVLQVEEEIARVRGEIEGMEAEQKGLEHRVDFASVDLKLVEEYTAQLGTPAEGVGTRVHNSLVAGVQNAGASLLGLLLFVEEYGPVMLIWGAILGVPGWLVWRRYRRARASLE